MFEKIAKCPVCRDTEYSNFLICKDHLVSGESFALSKCAQCGFIFTNPRPDKQEIGRYYRSDQYISHQGKANSLINVLYMLARVFTLRSKYRLVRRLSKGRYILDVGCGTGDFLAHCRKKGWEVAGVEPDEQARSRAESVPGIRVRGSLQAMDQGEKYDIVTMWHSLEHIHDLNGTLDRLHGLLAKKGVLLIAVPNHLSLDAVIYGEHWAAWDVPRHLYHFSPDTLRQLLQRHGFKLKKTVPMRLDAYYVSLLSEKYKSGRASFLKAIINAYKSNYYAKKNRNLYSSLIYIFTR